MSATCTGMQQKEGTNYDGPKPVDVASLAPSSAYSNGAFSSLASKIGSLGIAATPVVTHAVAKPTTSTTLANTNAASHAIVEITPTAMTTLPNAPNLSIVVLDSGSLISSGSVMLHATSAGFELLTRIYRENNAQTRFVTTQAVLNELKDEKTREMMERLPFKIEVLSVDPEAIKECYRFATLTGDAKTLSATDIQIIALTYQLERQHNGHRFIKTEPRRSKAMDAVSAASTTTEGESSSSASNEVPAVTPQESAEDAAAEEALSGEDEDLTAVPADAPVTDVASSSGESDSKSSSSTSSAAAVAAAAAAAFDGGDDGEGAWITPSNIHKQAPPPPAKSSEPESTIAVITTDYAMQNVLLQLGLRLLNIRGRSIRSIRNWQKKCHACGTLSTDMSREFCSACGGHTMIRVNVTVNKAGLVRYWHGSRHLNLRGTIYSIPMPRAGRHANNLKLSEDVIDERIRKGGGLMGRTGDGGKNRGEKTPAQLFDDGIEFGLGRTGPNSNQFTYGYGRKNPNAQRGGGKKKGKK